MNGERPGNREAVERIAERIVVHERQRARETGRRAVGRDAAKTRAIEVVRRRERKTRD